MSSTAFIWCKIVVDNLPHLGSKGAYLKQLMRDKLIEHKLYIDEAWRGPAGNPELEVGPAQMNTQELIATAKDAGGRGQRSARAG
jgi:hypothetical protein